MSNKQKQDDNLSDASTRGSSVPKSPSQNPSDSKTSQTGEHNESAMNKLMHAIKTAMNNLQHLGDLFKGKSNKSETHPPQSSNQPTQQQSKRKQSTQSSNQPTQQQSKRQQSKRKQSTQSLNQPTQQQSKRKQSTQKRQTIG